MSKAKGGSHYFLCACGCGTKSDPLEKSYVRLVPPRRWYANGCEPEGEEVVRSFKGGKIVKESDF